MLSCQYMHVEKVNGRHSRLGVEQRPRPLSAQGEGGGEGRGVCPGFGQPPTAEFTTSNIYQPDDRNIFPVKPSLHEFSTHRFLSLSIPLPRAGRLAVIDPERTGTAQ